MAMPTPPPRQDQSELLVMILDKARWGFTKAEAYAHCEVLMKECKYFIDANNQLWECLFSFCKH
jgi:hypothetical protein